MPAGRPRKLSDGEVQVIIDLLEEYLKKTECPIIAEFAYTNNVSRDDLYNYKEFSTLIKRFIDKKESYLEKNALMNNINPTMAIFSLKQLGWRDKHEYDQTIKGDLDSKITVGFVTSEHKDTK